MRSDAQPFDQIHQTTSRPAFEETNLRKHRHCGSEENAAPVTQSSRLVETQDGQLPFAKGSGFAHELRFFLRNLGKPPGG